MVWEVECSPGHASMTPWLPNTHTPWIKKLNMIFIKRMMWKEDSLCHSFVLSSQGKRGLNVLNCLLPFLCAHIHPSYYLRPTEEGVFGKKERKTNTSWKEDACILILREHRKPNAFRKGPLHGVICLVWHHSLLYNFSPVTMETCFSVAVIVNQDLSLFPFHHEALYPYGLNHSSHWQWHRSNIIAPHKTMGCSLSFPLITRSCERQLKSNFYKETQAPLGSSATYPHDRMPSRGGWGLLSFQLPVPMGKERQESSRALANLSLQAQTLAGSCVRVWLLTPPLILCPCVCTSAFHWALVLGAVCFPFLSDWLSGFLAAALL